MSFCKNLFCNQHFREFKKDYHENEVARASSLQTRQLQTRCLRYIFAFLFFYLLGCESGPPPEMTAPGALIYYGYVNKDAQCSRCHGDEGQGGMFGPKIRDIVEKRGVERVRDIIENGKGEGDKKMPDFAQQLKPAQIAQVIRFLQTWNIAAPADSVTTDFVH
jgi:mono/diheme cytochrome c family protein